MAKKLTELIAPHFHRVHRACKKHRYTHYCEKGGRGSTKSSFISVEIINLLVTHPNCHAVVMRKVGSTLRNSVVPQMEWVIEQMDALGEFKIRTSPPEITYKKTGQKILFLGVDDKSKVKSLKLPFGYVGIVWYEELDQFAGMDEIRSLNQSLLRGGPEYWCFYSFNPPKSQNNWVNEEMLLDDPDRLVDHSTYLDVPPEWLGEQFLLEADKLKQKNEMAYRHEYLGEVTGTGGAVFDNVEDRKMDDQTVNGFDRLYFGLDFGFTIDPLAFVSIYYDAKHEDIYIFDEIYQQRLTNSRATNLIRVKAGTSWITADGAEPKSIAEMNELGLHVQGAKKGRDSVDFGIKWLQDRNHIYIDKRRAPNTFREFVSYEYERNRDGQFISAYPDADNHSIDAARYALDSVMRRSRIVPKRISY